MKQISNVDCVSYSYFAYCQHLPTAGSNKVSRKLWSHPKLEQASTEMKQLETDVDTIVQLLIDGEQIKSLKIWEPESEEERQDYMTVFLSLPPVQNELVVLGLPCADFEKPRATVSQMMNPHGTRYVFSITYRDYTLAPSGNFVETLCTLCVVSEHLLPHVFSGVLASFIMKLQADRKMYAGTKSPTDSLRECRDSLDSLRQQRVDANHIKYVDPLNRKVNYRIEIDLLEYQEAMESIKPVFRRLSMKRIIYILSAILQEKTVVLHSRSRLMCTHSM